ncbi:MAG: hypothetical protein M4579_001773 [Chaenotheca gracillima]|nr:MAG: hypothetical protein M4579_001773 [Chaenotheca gracillima]
MAYEGYRSPPPGRPEQPFPSDNLDGRPPYPTAAYPAPYPQEHTNGRNRASSMRPDGFPPFDTNRYAPAKPINEAVTSAFRRADYSDYNYPPELVSQISAQITEDVINRLRAGNLDSGAPSATPSMARSHSNSGSHTHSNSASPPPAGSTHTPPSPRPRPDFPRYNSPPTQPIATPIPGPLPRSPREQTAPRPTERRTGSPDPNQSPSRARKPTEVPRSPSRTRKPQQAGEVEETAVDRRWGRLFEDGKATDRLGQFFRGLARHIIKDFEPKNSLVITPVKMAKYYELARVEFETHPWNVLFKTLSPARLGRVYQDLECQHHLVQARGHDECPSVPGLTPEGFQRWMTLILLSNPDNEVERLQKTVLDMPISNADDSSERFPKEVSRHLFPTEEDWKMRSKLDKAFTIDKPQMPEVVKPEVVKPDLSRPAPKTEPIRPIPKPDPVRSEPPMSPAPSLSSSYSNLERERKPYSNTPSESAIDDLPGPPSGPLPGPPPGPPPTKLERERQPYRVQPGGARVYDNDKKMPSNLERANSTSKVRPQQAQPRPGGGEGMPPINIQIPDVPGHHRAASTSVNPAPRGRRRSPSISGHPPSYDFRRSDNDILGYRDTPTAPMNIFDDDPNGPRRYPPGPPRPRGNEDDVMRGGFESPRDRERYDRVADIGAGPRRGYEEDYYRPADLGRGPGSAGPGSAGIPFNPPPPAAGPGYDYNPNVPYPPSGYR